MLLHGSAERAQQSPANTPIPKLVLQSIKRKGAFLSLCLPRCHWLQRCSAKGELAGLRLEYRCGILPLRVLCSHHRISISKSQPCFKAQQALLPMGLGIHFHWYLLSSWKIGNKTPALSMKPTGIIFQPVTSHFLDQVKFYLPYPWLLGTVSARNPKK